MAKYVFVVTAIIGVLAIVVGGISSVPVCSCPAQIAGQPQNCVCPLPLEYYLLVYGGIIVALVSSVAFVLTSWKGPVLRPAVRESGAVEVFPS